MLLRMKVVGALFVIGVSPATRSHDDVTRVIERHLELGRVYSSVRLRGVWYRMPAFARSVGTGELCLAGRCVSADAESVPHPDDPERWPLSYEVRFEWVLRHVRAADVLGQEASGRRVRGLSKEAVNTAEAAFAEAVGVDEWLLNPS